jgi:hypothetical protein
MDEQDLELVALPAVQEDAGARSRAHVEVSSCAW